jgi:hypothetical protein
MGARLYHVLQLPLLKSRYQVVQSTILSYLGAALWQNITDAHAFIKPLYGKTIQIESKVSEIFSPLGLPSDR